LRAIDGWKEEEKRARTVREENRIRKHAPSPQTNAYTKYVDLAQVILPAKIEKLPIAHGKQKAARGLIDPVQMHILQGQSRAVFAC
jgi:hypothetical protein